MFWEQIFWLLANRWFILCAENKGGEEWEVVERKKGRAKDHEVYVKQDQQQFSVQT